MISSLFFVPTGEKKMISINYNCVRVCAYVCMYTMNTVGTIIIIQYIIKKWIRVLTSVHLFCEGTKTCLRKRYEGSQFKSKGGWVTICFLRDAECFVSVLRKWRATLKIMHTFHAVCDIKITWLLDCSSNNVIVFGNYYIVSGKRG